MTTEEILREANNFCAFTDLAMGILILPMIFVLLRFPTGKKRLRMWWTLVFVTLAGASFLGFLAHYCFPEGIINRIVWFVLYPLLFEICVCFVLTGIASLTEEKKPTGRDVLIVHLCGAAGVLAAVLIRLPKKDADPIRLLSVFAGIIGLTGFGIFLRAAFLPGRRGERALFLSFIPLLAGAFFEVQRNTLIHVIWYIDHDGITHLFFILGIAILFFAVLSCLREKTDA